MLLLSASLFWIPVASSLRRKQLTERHRSVWQRAALKVRNDSADREICEAVVTERLKQDLAGRAVCLTKRTRKLRPTQDELQLQDGTEPQEVGWEDVAEMPVM